MPAERATMEQQRILDRYRLLERLAVGGSAEVWRAHDEQLDRAVAVKRLHPHLLPDAASRRRLRAEARAAASLSHPGIVAVYDVDTEGEAPALVMELVDGESLSARVARDGPLSGRDAAAITADVADALFHAHQRGVVHRDVKPGNVLLSRDGRARLVDFGIAHSLAESAERLTLTGTVMGTLSAMAPEQLADGPITPRTDLYGLGVVLHEALTGRPPYAASSPVALADAQRAGPPSLPDVDPALAAVVTACLAYDPAERPLHAGAVADALRAWLDGDARPALRMMPPPAADPEAVTRPVPRPPVAAPVAHPRPVRSPRRATARRGLLLPIVAALAALVLVGAVGAGLLPSSGAAEVPASASPMATAPPAWIEELAASIGAACGPEAADASRDAMLAMTEEEARAYADDQIAACTDAGTGGGKPQKPPKGDKPGKGNGRGGG
jgi:serine/threonine-protein kinase